MPSSEHPGLYTLSLHDALPISSALELDATASTLASGTALRMASAATWAFSLVRLPMRTCPPCLASSRATRCPTGPVPPSTSALHRSEEHTSELQSRQYLVCRLLSTPGSTLFPYTTLFRSRRHWNSTPPPPRWRPAPPCGWRRRRPGLSPWCGCRCGRARHAWPAAAPPVARPGRCRRAPAPCTDRKSTRLNSSHANISYAVF